MAVSILSMSPSGRSCRPCCVPVRAPPEHDNKKEKRVLRVWFGACCACCACCACASPPPPPPPPQLAEGNTSAAAKEAKIASKGSKGSKGKGAGGGDKGSKKRAAAPSESLSELALSCFEECVGITAHCSLETATAASRTAKMLSVSHAAASCAIDKEPELPCAG